MSNQGISLSTFVARKGDYDGKKCLVHARCCKKDNFMLATAQYLNVEGSDLFSGLYMSKSCDGGMTWSEFVEQEGLKPIDRGDEYDVCCDGTPMYHKASGKIILLGHTANYIKGAMHPTCTKRKTFYSVYDEENDCFTRARFVEMPEGYECCGNGSGQSWELDNGDILIPVSFEKPGNDLSYSAVMRCSFNGVNVKMQEIGKALYMPFGRGLAEPSVICHKGIYYLTLRNDECALIAQSRDGINYTDLQLWKWEDGSILDSYNTQQHWMTVGENLYLIYTRRGAENDHVFRHRAPLFTARVENMRLVKESEQSFVPQRGARLGNFGVSQLDDNSAVIMAAEWMQPKGCEKYGSDNTIFITFAEE